MEDSQIIALYWNRDESAIRESDAAHGAYCFAVAMNVLSNREDSEECVSDTWLRAWNVIPPQKPARLRCFFARITRNLAIDRYRKRTAEKRNENMNTVIDELEGILSGSESVESEMDRHELTASLNRFLASLSVRDRQIFVRRYFWCHDVAKIAEEMGLKRNSVNVMLHRMRNKLKTHLTKDGWEV